MEERRGTWGAIIIVLLIIVFATFVGVPYVIHQVISNTVDSALEPVEQTSQQLKTQVSDMMNPTPTIMPDPITIVREVRPLARLETIQYSVEKVITAEVGQDVLGGLLYGDRLLFVAHGTVIAGVDLGHFQPENIEFDGEVLYVTLPEPEVFIATLDNSKSYIYERTKGILTKGDVNLETTARQAAEAEILNAALEDGILENAKANAENFLSGYFKGLGYDNVVFYYALPLNNE